MEKHVHFGSYSLVPSPVQFLIATATGTGLGNET